jgi:hypothetical protein
MMKMTTTADKILRKIRTKGRGWVFTPKDFLDFGSRAAVDQTLWRLVKKGMIRRLGHGLYDYPKQHATLGVLTPDADSIAHAVAVQTGDRIFPSGAVAANNLGLSTQVPAKPTYLTSGVSRTKTVAGRAITFKRARIALLDNAPDKVNYMLQALAYLGKDQIDGDMINLCAKRLDDSDLKALNKSRALVPGWMSDVILKIDAVKHG